jgi:transposase-like protein
MSASILSAPCFHDELAAYDYVETKLWPNGPVCPKCGSVGQHYKLKGKSTRCGVHKCRDCRKPFRVTVGTIFESSHIPLRVWLQAVFLMASSKKGISSNQLSRMLGVTIKAAWFMSHRLREAMKDSGDLMGGLGKTVEADETYLSKSPKTRKPAGTALNAKTATQVFSLVERGGPIRSMFIDHKNVGEFLKKDSVRSALHRNLSPDSRLVTDGSNTYRFQVKNHESVDHSKFEWKRGDVHTNTLEGFFSIFKRGLVGTYQHMDNKHLDRYLAEFDFRFNNRAALDVNDVQRADNLLLGVVGKRLTYETTNI